MSNKNKKSKKVVAEAAATATTTPEVEAPASGGGGGSAYAKDDSNVQKLLRAPGPKYLATPFGQTYLSRRQRPLPADSIQAIGQMWLFDVHGYRKTGAPTPSLQEYDGADKLFLKWYTYARQEGKASLKFKQTPTTLHTPDLIADYLNHAFYVIANTGTLLNLDSLPQYGTAFNAVYTYLPGYISRLRKIWKGANAPFLPSFIKAHALRAAMPATLPGYAMHFRLWSEAYLTMHSWAADYTDLSTESVYDILSDNTKLGNLVNNLENALGVLDGITTSSANDQEDLTSIVDVIDMLNDVVKGLFTQGLPDWKKLPGYLNDVDLLDDWYRSVVIGIDTNPAADKLQMFPVIKEAQFHNLVPVFRRDPKVLDDKAFWTFLGAPKCAQMKTAGSETYSAPIAGDWVLYGTDTPSNVYNEVSIYTREDGWVDILGSGDFNDGTAIRTNINSGHPTWRNPFFPTLFRTELGVAFEARFVDNVDDPVAAWMDPDDLGGNYASYLGAQLGVPYLAET